MQSHWKEDGCWKKDDTKKEENVVRGLVKNFEKIEIDRKKTFDTMSEDNNAIRKKIDNFKLLSTNSYKCLIGSCRCANVARIPP